MRVPVCRRVPLGVDLVQPICHGAAIALKSLVLALAHDGTSSALVRRLALAAWRDLSMDFVQEDLPGIMSIAHSVHYATLEVRSNRRVPDGYGAGLVLSGLLLGTDAPAFRRRCYEPVVDWRVDHICAVGKTGSSRSSGRTVLRGNDHPSRCLDFSVW